MAHILGGSATPINLLSQYILIEEPRAAPPQHSGHLLMVKLASEIKDDVWDGTTRAVHTG